LKKFGIFFEFIFFSKTI